MVGNKNKNRHKDMIKKRLIPYTAHYFADKTQISIGDSGVVNMLAIVIFADREKFYKGTYKVHNELQWDLSSFKEGLKRMDVSITKISALDNILDKYTFITHEFIDNTYTNNENYPDELKRILDKRIRDNKLKYILGNK
jgi:hypothetical protein